MDEGGKRMGYMGRILRVDLDNGAIGYEALNRTWAQDFIGGRGLGMRYLFEEVDLVGMDKEIMLLYQLLL